MAATTTNATDIVPPEVTTPTRTRSIRATRTRVARVFQRLRRRDPIDLQKTKFELESSDCLKETQLTCQSEVSDITDTLYDDDLSLDNGKIKSSRRHKSSVPLTLDNATNSTDPSLSQSLGTWCKHSITEHKKMNPYEPLMMKWFHSPSVRFSC